MALRALVADPPQRPLTLWLLTLLVLSGGSFALPLHVDTAHEITMAMECVREGICDQGVPSALTGVTHGAFILRIIEVVIRLGLPWATLRFLMSGFIAAAIVVAAIQVRRVFSWRLTWLGYGVIALLASHRFLSTIVWNVSPHPFFCAVFVWGLLRCVASGGTGDALLAAAGLGLAIDTELAAVVALPVAAGLLAASAKRPWLALSGSVLTFVAGPLLFSARIWMHNIESLQSAHGNLLWLGLGSVSMCVLAGLALRQRWQNVPTQRRLLVTLVLLTTAVYVASLMAHQAGMLERTESWYFGASWTAEICLAFAVWHRFAPAWTNRLMPAANLVGAGLLSSVFIQNALPELALWRPLEQGSLPAFSVDDVDRVSTFLKARGLSQQAAARHLWTTGSDEVVKQLAAFLPRTTEPYAGKDLLIVKAPASIATEAIPAGWSTIPLGWSQTALVHEFYSELDASPVQVELRFAGREPSSLTTTKEEWQHVTHDSTGTPGLAGMGMGSSDRILLHLDRRAPRGRKLFLAMTSPDDARWNIVSGAGSAPCHYGDERERPLTIEGHAVRFPDLIEINLDDRGFLTRALPSLDWTGCPP